MKGKKLLASCGYFALVAFIIVTAYMRNKNTFSPEQINIFGKMHSYATAVIKKQSSGGSLDFLIDIDSTKLEGAVCMIRSDTYLLEGTLHYLTAREKKCLLDFLLNPSERKTFERKISTASYAGMYVIRIPESLSETLSASGGSIRVRLNNKEFVLGTSNMVIHEDVLNDKSIQKATFVVIQPIAENEVES